jgi:hypothetical protein
MTVNFQAPGFIVAAEAKESPLKIYFGTSHGDITKKRTADVKALKKAKMDQNNKVAEIAKNNKDFKKENEEKN